MQEFLKGIFTMANFAANSRKCRQIPRRFLIKVLWGVGCLTSNKLQGHDSGSLPAGRLVAPIQFKLGRADGHRGQLGCAKFHLNRHSAVGMWPQNMRVRTMHPSNARRSGLGAWQKKTKENKHHIFAPTAGAHCTIFPKLCMVIELVVPIIKGVIHF